MQPNSSSGFSTPGSSPQNGLGEQHEGDADMADLDDIAFDQILGDLEFVDAAYNQHDVDMEGYNQAGVNQPIPNQGQTLHPQSLNQPDLNQFPNHPGFNQPVNPQPNFSQGVNQPGFNQPGFNQPVNPQPNFSQGVNQPGFNQPGFNQPVNPQPNQPGLGQSLNQPDFPNQFNLHQPAAINEASLHGVNQVGLPAANGYAHEGKTVQDMMNEDNHGVYQGYIRSHEHAAQLEAQYLAITAAKIAPSIRPESLGDIPRTDEARAHWRERIFHAITDFGNVVNKDRKKVGKDKAGNRVDKGTVVNTHVRRVRNLGGFEDELMADKILKWAVEAHEGNPGIPPWCEKRSWHLEQFPTFNARMEAVLEALRTNKSVPHSYVQIDPTRRFVAAPKREIRRKADNMDGNEKRGDLIDEGRQAKQKEGN